jgi:threonyl-tRNA synthetase
MAKNTLHTFDNEDSRRTYLHTCAHILAHAVKRLYPESKLAIGSATDTGYYYDFDSAVSFTPELLEKIEAEMAKICMENLKIERFELPCAEALALMKDEPYKSELLNELLENAVISFYRQGDFTDQCAGPHLDSTGYVNGDAVRLTSCTSAYWRGDAKNMMLQRIYGTAFPSKEEKQKNATITRLAASWGILRRWTPSARGCLFLCPTARASSSSLPALWRTRSKNAAIC